MIKAFFKHDKSADASVAKAAASVVAQASVFIVSDLFMVVLFALKNFGVSFELKTPREYRKQQRPARRKTKIPHRKRSLRKLSALPIRGKPNENTHVNTRLLAKTADKKSKFSGLPATCVAVAFRQTNSYHSGATASESNGLPFVRGFSFKEQIRFKTLWDIRQLKFFSKFFRGLRRFFMAFQILTSRLCVFIFSLSAEALRVPLLFIFCNIFELFRTLVLNISIYPAETRLPLTTYLFNLYRQAFPWRPTSILNVDFYILVTQINPGKKVHFFAGI